MMSIELSAPVLFRKRPLTYAVHLALLGLPLAFTLPLPVNAAEPMAPASTRDQTLPEVKVEAATPPTYGAKRSTAATKTDTALRDVPQSVSVVTQELIKDQSMQSMEDVVRYTPGVGMAQGESHRDNPVIRGNASSADFFVDGLRDDAQYKRDLYNLERVEVLKGPNAMVFGRGGGGGVINSVTKEAGWDTVRELTLQAGSYNNKRLAIDIGQGINEVVAFRLNSVVEKSDSFRDHVSFERYGINPTVTIAPSARTKIKLGYEYFKDNRTTDRGIPSFQGRPSNAEPSTFFGNPDLSNWEATKNAFSATIDHDTSAGLHIRNSTLYSNVDKFYQNVFPGAVSPDGTRVALSAYNNNTPRRSLINQTELTYTLQAGSVKHKLLLGTEFGRQESEGFRNTGFFNNSTTSISVPFANPTDFTPVTFRQNATDANAQSTASIAALYAQDQIEFSRQWQAIAGLRYDNFKLDYRNNRNGQELSRTDNLLSPRLGLVFKPIDPVSLYASYSVSYLPYSGDQFTTLDVTTQTLKPEKFTNYELGAKWDILPALSLNSAIYQLDRTNTRATDPNNPAITLQTGSTRSKGFELGLTGNITSAWQVMGGYAYQNAYIDSDTNAAKAGAKVPLVPRHTVSLWNKYQITPAWGAGLGVIHQSDIYAAIDNSVTLPDYTRVDAALYFKISKDVRAQLNLENLFDRQYYPNANSNNNITPGSPRAVRVTLAASF
jgi:catecholate siderophore receptor